MDPANLPVLMKLHSDEVLLSAVQASDGIAALSEHVACAALAAGLVEVIRFELPARPFHLLRYRVAFAPGLRKRSRRA